jgi:glycogen debranching enzyme
VPRSSSAAHLRVPRRWGEHRTRYGIRLDPADSLLAEGTPGWALTWMDARVYGVPVTPRTGKPVEVNALWINALRVLAGLRERAGQDVAALWARAGLAELLRVRGMTLRI